MKPISAARVRALLNFQGCLKYLYSTAKVPPLMDPSTYLYLRNMSSRDLPDQERDVVSFHKCRTIP